MLLILKTILSGAVFLYDLRVVDTICTIYITVGKREHPANFC